MKRLVVALITAGLVVPVFALAQAPPQTDQPKAEKNKKSPKKKSNKRKQEQPKQQKK